MQPKTVLLNPLLVLVSLLVLESLQEWGETTYKSNLSYDQFYLLDLSRGKTLSDVFAQVNLATRRLKLIAHIQ